MMRVDLDKLRIILTPHALRGGALLEAMMRTLYRPLKRLQRDFDRYVAREERERQYGSTVKQLRQAIADHLGIDADEVKIGDVENRDTVDLHRWADGEEKAVMLGREAVRLWSDDMVWWNREFAVVLPRMYASSDSEVRAVLDRWKMACSRYTIRYE